MAVSANEPLYVLLRRAMNDSGNEGDIAWNKFVERANNIPGSIFFLTKEFSNPLMYVVEEYEQRIKDLESRNEHLQRQFDEAGIPLKKQKVASFPWEKYPEIEVRAFEMRFKEKKPVATIIDYILQHCPEAEDNTTFVNQRFVHNRPSSSFNIEVKTGSEPIDWAELWKIGTCERTDRWIQRVIYYGGGLDKFLKDGLVPKEWPKVDPNKIINAKGRKTLRDLFHHGFLSPVKELESFIEEAGPTGITHKELLQRGADHRRFDELENQSVIFKDNDQWVHYGFGHLFANNPKASLCSMKYIQEHGREFDITISKSSQMVPS
jgi:hypothetical protein